jgi:hypothetical protein
MLDIIPPWAWALAALVPCAQLAAVFWFTRASR